MKRKSIVTSAKNLVKPSNLQTNSVSSERICLFTGFPLVSIYQCNANLPANLLFSLCLRSVVTSHSTNQHLPAALITYKSIHFILEMILFHRLFRKKC